MTCESAECGVALSESWGGGDTVSIVGLLASIEISTRKIIWSVDKNTLWSVDKNFRSVDKFKLRQPIGKIFLARKEIKQMRLRQVSKAEIMEKSKKIKTSLLTKNSSISLAQCRNFTATSNFQIHRKIYCKKATSVQITKNFNENIFDSHRSQINYLAASNHGFSGKLNTITKCEQVRTIISLNHNSRNTNCKRNVTFSVPACKDKKSEFARSNLFNLFFRKMSSSSSKGAVKKPNTKSSSSGRQTSSSNPGTPQTPIEVNRTPKNSRKFSPTDGTQGNSQKKLKDDQSSEIDSEDWRWLSEEEKRQSKTNRKDEELARKLNSSLKINSSTSGINLILSPASNDNNAQAINLNLQELNGTQQALTETERSLVVMLETQTAASDGEKKRLEDELAQMKREAVNRERELERVRLEGENLKNRNQMSLNSAAQATNVVPSTSLSLPNPSFPTLIIPRQQATNDNEFEELPAQARATMESIEHLAPGMETNTVMIISKLDYPNALVDEDEFESIQKRCNEALVATEDEIKVESISHKQGVVAVTCLNIATVRWLIVVIDCLEMGLICEAAAGKDLLPAFLIYVPLRNYSYDRLKELHAEQLLANQWRYVKTLKEVTKTRDGKEITRVGTKFLVLGPLGLKQRISEHIRDNPKPRNSPGRNEMEFQFLMNRTKGTIVCTKGIVCRNETGNEGKTLETLMVNKEINSIYFKMSQKKMCWQSWRTRLFLRRRGSWRDTELSTKIVGSIKGPTESTTPSTNQKSEKRKKTEFSCILKIIKVTSIVKLRREKQEVSYCIFRIKKIKSRDKLSIQIIAMIKSKRDPKKFSLSMKLEVRKLYQKIKLSTHSSGVHSNTKAIKYVRIKNKLKPLGGTEPSINKSEIKIYYETTNHEYQMSKEKYPIHRHCRTARGHDNQVRVTNECSPREYSRKLQNPAKALGSATSTKENFKYRRKRNTN